MIFKPKKYEPEVPEFTEEDEEQLIEHINQWRSGVDEEFDVRRCEGADNSEFSVTAEEVDEHFDELEGLIRQLRPHDDEDAILCGRNYQGVINYSSFLTKDEEPVTAGQLFELLKELQDRRREDEEQSSRLGRIFSAIFK